MLYEAVCTHAAALKHIFSPQRSTTVKSDLSPVIIHYPDEHYECLSQRGWL